MTATPSDDRRDAEEELWRALVERAKRIKKAGLKLSRNHLDWMGQAHRKGRLIDELNEVMEEEADRTEISSRHAHQMAETLAHGLEVWEQVLIRPGAPWLPYVTPKARRGARKSIGETEAWVKDPARNSRSVRTISGGGFETNRSKH